MARTKRPKKQIIVGVSIIALLAIIATVIAIVGTLSRPDSPSAQAVAPDFEAVLPEKASIDDLGGWQKLTPPSGDEYYVYTDTLESVLITVSQQPLPNTFADNRDAKMTELAQAYNATSTLDASGTKVYLGTSAQGPQSVLFTKNNLLILIKSQSKIQDNAWISYANSLQ